MMLKGYNEFGRRPDLQAKFDAVLQSYSATAIFAEVQYRIGVMDSGIKPAFHAKICAHAITVRLSKGDVFDPLKALEMGQAGDVIVANLMGVTVIPAATAEEVVRLAREQADCEEKTRAWVKQGKTAADVFNGFGRIRACSDRD